MMIITLNNYIVNKFKHWLEQVTNVFFDKTISEL